MKNLWSGSLLALSLAGCVTIKPPDVTHNQPPVTCGTSPVTCYTPPSSSHLFKATLDIRKHHLTGLLLIKRTDTIGGSGIVSGDTLRTGAGDAPGIYRIVFFNEVGMTFFDLEMKAESFSVISCFGSLNKKTLVNILETDFRILIRTGRPGKEKTYRQAGTHNLVIAGKAGKYKTWQTYTPSGDTLLKTSSKSTIADPVMITFGHYDDGFPKKILIENPVIGLTLSLRKLSR